MARVAFDSLTGVTADVLLCIRWYELSPLSEMSGLIVRSLVSMAVFKTDLGPLVFACGLGPTAEMYRLVGCSLAGRAVPTIGLDPLV